MDFGPSAAVSTPKLRLLRLGDAMQFGCTGDTWSEMTRRGCVFALIRPFLMDKLHGKCLFP